jgi:hypothetical protein
MAVRQIKILKRNNDDISFEPPNINSELMNYMKNYEENLLNCGKVLKQKFYKLGKNKLVTEIIYKDIPSFLSTCDDLSKDTMLNSIRFEIAKYHAENNIIETQTRDFSYNLES